MLLPRSDVAHKIPTPDPGGFDWLRRIVAALAFFCVAERSVVTVLKVSEEPDSPRWYLSPT